MKLSLKACRVNVNASAKEMAAYIGVTEDTIYNWENGRSAPKATQVIRILEFFDSKGFSVQLNNLKFLS